MKRGTKFILGTLLVVFCVGIALEGGLNAALSHLAMREVNRLIAWMPEGEVSCGNIRVELISGTATIEDVHFVYRGEPEKGKKTAPGSDIHVDRIEVGRVFFKLLSDKQALMNSISIIGPRIELWLDEEHPERCFPAFESKLMTGHK